MHLRDLILNESRLWTGFSKLGTGKVATSSILGQHATGGPNIVHEDILERDLPRWLTSCWYKDTPDVKDNNTLHLVWVERNPGTCVDHIKEDDLNKIVNAFSLGSASEHYPTAFAGIECVKEQHTQSVPTYGQYCFRIHPKIILLWSTDFDHNKVRGICFANNAQITRLKKLLTVEWNSRAMLLPFMCAVMLNLEIDESQAKVKEDIRAIEVRTGFHSWGTRHETPAVGDLNTLSARMSGLATRMAAVTRKGKVVAQLLHFLIEHEDVRATRSPTPSSQTELLIKQDLIYLLQRTKMQDIDTELIKRRIDIQISALSSLIAQFDALAGHLTAQETKAIAVASKQDSSSMKTIAVVTIFYLPAQVVASIFSMPVFGWSSESTFDSTSDRATNTQFSTYWAITIPLTLATFAFAALSALVSWRLLFHSRKSSAETVLQVNSCGTEVGRLINRRSTVTMKLTNTFETGHV